ncbi:MAG: hypothetical protein ATN35_01340 [Epulopiscium sp. Nele67-Bin004]|nr:MAG: hypothetical protein ATN35_01340 [Epulopiscium sp. Nele67-Bin004]
MRAKRSDIIIYTLLICLTLFQMWLITGLPIALSGNSALDDALLVNLSVELRNGNWLGAYDYTTLIKNISFPMFLSTIKGLNISYPIALNSLYILGIITFLSVIKKLVNKNWLYFMYVFMLFSPIIMDLQAYQRVYRMSIVPTTVIWVVALFVAMYLNCAGDIKKYSCLSVLAGLVLSFFWFIREDSIWIAPFIGGIFCLIVLKLYMKKLSKKEVITRVALSLIPLVLVSGTRHLISSKNLEEYGLYTTSELTNSEFADMISNIYMVKQDEDIPYVWVNRSTLEKIYEASSTFEYLKEPMDYIYEYGYWPVHGMNLDNGTEIEKDYIMWALRDAGMYIGLYSDAAYAESFYKQVNYELDVAFKTGKLEKDEDRGLVISSLAKPLKTEDLPLLFKTFFESLDWVVTYEKLYTSQAGSSGTYEQLAKMDGMTNGVVRLPDTADVDDIGEIDIANNIMKLYKWSGTMIFVMAIACYAAIFVYLIRNRKYGIDFEVFCIITGILGSMCVLIGGVSMNYMEAWNSDLRNSYMAGAYPLLQMFNLLSIGYCHTVYKERVRWIKG